MADEEIEIGGTAAGIVTEADKLVTTTQQVTTQQTVHGYVPVMGMNYVQGQDAAGNVVAAPVIGVAGYMPMVSYQQSITTQTHTRMDPGEYEGETDPETGKRQGEGKCEWNDDSVYEGQWKDGYRHGQGTFTSKNGDVHVGEWFNDIRHGPGKVTYKNGNAIKGTWENDRLNGEGEILNKGKESKPCVFKNDLAIQTYGQGNGMSRCMVLYRFLLCVGLYSVAAVAELGPKKDLWALFVFMYILYICTSWSDDTLISICHFKTYEESIDTALKRVEARPEVKFHVQCWHWESPDQNGTYHRIGPPPPGQAPQEEQISPLKMLAENYNDTTSTNAKQTIHRGTGRIKFKPVQIIVKDTQWRDQGWGHTKGTLFINLTRNGNFIKNENIFGAYDRSGQQTDKTYTVDDEIVSLAEPGDVYKILSRVGGGGGHTLTVQYIQIQINENENDERDAKVIREEERQATEIDTEQKRRVNTHSNSKVFEFTEWADQSPPVDSIRYIDVFWLTRLKTKFSIDFSGKAAQAFDKQKEEFVQENIKDTFYDVTEAKLNPQNNLPTRTTTLGPGRYELTNIDVNEMIHNPARGRRPFFSRWWCIMLMDVFALGWPLYFINDYYSTIVEYEIKKYIISNDDVTQEPKTNGE